MSVDGLGWLGVRTDRFEETVALYRDLLGLEAFQEDGTSARFRLGDGTRFFGTAPVVGLEVDDAEGARARLGAAGVELLTEIERAGGAAWCHFRGPDGNGYELISGGGTGR